MKLSKEYDNGFSAVLQRYFCYYTAEGDKLMAKNDLLLLDGILDGYVSRGLPSTQLDEAFEYLAYQQVLKDYDISHDAVRESFDNRVPVSHRRAVRRRVLLQAFKRFALQLSGQAEYSHSCFHKVA